MRAFLNLAVRGAALTAFILYAALTYAAVWGVFARHLWIDVFLFFLFGAGAFLSLRLAVSKDK